MPDLTPERLEELATKLCRYASPARCQDPDEVDLIVKAYLVAARRVTALEQSIADSAADDTAIRKLCGHVDDGYTVPIVEVVEKLAAENASLKNELTNWRMGTCR